MLSVHMALEDSAFIHSSYYTIIKKKKTPHIIGSGAAETNLTSIHENVGLIPGFIQGRGGGGGSDVAMSCGGGCRCGSDLAWL